MEELVNIGEMCCNDTSIEDCNKTPKNGESSFGNSNDGNEIVAPKCKGHEHNLFTPETKSSRNRMHSNVTGKSTENNTGANKIEQNFKDFDLTPPPKMKNVSNHFKETRAKFIREFKYGKEKLEKELKKMKDENNEDKIEILKLLNKKVQKIMEMDPKDMNTRIALFLFSRHFDTSENERYSDRYMRFKNLLFMGIAQEGNMRLRMGQVIGRDGDGNLDSDDKYLKYFVISRESIIRYFQQSDRTYGFLRDMKKINVFIRLQKFSSWSVCHDGISHAKYVVEDNGYNAVQFLEKIDNKLFHCDNAFRLPEIVRCALLNTEKEIQDVTEKFDMHGPALVSAFVVPKHFRLRKKDYFDNKFKLGYVRFREYNDFGEFIVLEELEQEKLDYMAHCVATERAQGNSDQDEMKLSSQPTVSTAASSYDDEGENFDDAYLEKAGPFIYHMDKSYEEINELMQILNGTDSDVDSDEDIDSVSDDDSISYDVPDEDLFNRFDPKISVEHNRDHPEMFDGVIQDEEKYVEDNHETNLEEEPGYNHENQKPICHAMVLIGYRRDRTTGEVFWL